MAKSTSKEPVATLGIDLAKRSFQLHGVDAKGRTVLTRTLSRVRLAASVARLAPCVVAMEACGSAHHWARTFRAFGHEVRLIAPQFVKPFVKSNKNDAADAEAICEAAQRPSMRFVAIKSVEQQDIQALHRLRSLVVGRRTAAVNQLRGLLLEYGIEVAQGRATLMRRLPEILEDAENGLSDRLRGELHLALDELRHLDQRIAHFDRQLEEAARADDRARALMSLPGVGVLGATALVAAVGEEPRLFRNGRALAAWLGLVPRQHSTGGRPRLLGISKRGDTYLRGLLIHGARAVLAQVDRKEDPMSRWALTLKQRRPSNVATVALANKIARMAWAVLTSGQSFDPALAAGARA